LTRAYFSLGSNLGDREAYLRAALLQLTTLGPCRVSGLYETDPWGPVAQNDFLNLVVEVETDLSPRELLAVIRELESAARREREVHWGPRTLDVDLVYMDGVTSSDPEILVPHPRWAERAFVMIPLGELRPDLLERATVDLAGGDVRPMGRLSDIG
jgi:2-amino-4-hydroxy-6-hydroxymethyldihydropteridine diphosphokinase